MNQSVFSFSILKKIITKASFCFQLTHKIDNSLDLVNKLQKQCLMNKTMILNSKLND